MTLPPRLQAWLWPKITDAASARQACRLGYWAATVLALLFCMSGTLAMLTPLSTGPNHEWDWFDAVVFMLIGWNVRYHSRNFAVLGVIFCAFELWVRFSPFSLLGWLLLLLWSFHGARGAQALLTMPPEPEVILAGEQE